MWMGSKVERGRKGDFPRKGPELWMDGTDRCVSD